MEGDSVRFALFSFFKAQAHILQDIHIGNEGFVRRLVRRKIFMHIAIVPPLGAHIVEVVGSLKLAPIFEKRRVVNMNNFFAQIIDGV